MIAPPSLPKPSIGSLRPSSSVTPPPPNASAPGVCDHSINSFILLCFLLGGDSEVLLGRARLPLL